MGFSVFDFRPKAGEEGPEDTLKLVTLVTELSPAADHLWSAFRVRFTGSRYSRLNSKRINTVKGLILLVAAVSVRFGISSRAEIDFHPPQLQRICPPTLLEVFQPSNSSVRCLISIFSAIPGDYPEALINLPSLWLHLLTAPQQHHPHTPLTCLSPTQKRDRLSICLEVRIKNVKNEHLSPLPHQPIPSARPPSHPKNRTMTTAPEAQVLTVTSPLLLGERVW